MQANRFSSSAKIAVLTAALAFGGSAFAASNQAAGASAASTASATSAAAAGQASSTDATPHVRHKQDRHHRGMHKRMRDVGMWVPGYGPLDKPFVASLSLTDSQNKLIDDARAAQDEARKSRREGMKEGHKSRIDQAKAGKIDPKAALAKRESAQEQAQAQRTKLDEKWLAVWDALDDTQQDKVAQYFAERAEKFAKRAEARKQHRAERKAGEAKTPDAAASVAS